MAMLDTIAVIDPQTTTVRWWQQGPFGMQHQPRIAPNGGIVVFDNYHSRQRSAVKVFDPRTHQVVWEYSGSDAEPLHSRRSGGAEFLSNGNLLVVETDRGRAFELTPEKRIVWEYRSRYRAGAQRQHVAGIYSMQRIDESEVSWLAR
jgi:DNA-binding beta-propeller fold protein YncE